MHEAVASRRVRYNCRTSADSTNPLREIVQEITLLGLDRYSENMDSSLLAATSDFDLGAYGRALEKELLAFGFRVSVQRNEQTRPSAVQSAFLKADTYRKVFVITTEEKIVKTIPKGSLLKIRFEVDTNPPGGFATESRVKGRDWYDFVRFVAKGTPLDLEHLAARMRQSGHLSADSVLTASLFRNGWSKKRRTST